MAVKIDLYPYEILGVEKNDDHAKIKAAFRQKIRSIWRIDRILASLSYHLIPKTKIVNGKLDITSVNQDQFFYAAVGNTAELRKIFGADISGVDNYNEDGCTMLYLAARCGFYDTCKFIISLGANVNYRQVRGSTALHAAAYFGHKLIVELLLQSGADKSIKNKFSNTAADESFNDDIEQLIVDSNTDKISNFVSKLTENNFCYNFRLIYHPMRSDEIIAKEIVCSKAKLNSAVSFQKIIHSWTLAWHGTQFKNLLSILANGLKPVGSEGIVQPEDRIELGTTIDNIDNWAAAVFVSPNVLYSAHPVYSERILADGKLWCCLLKVYCKPGYFTKHRSTVPGFIAKKDNLLTAEYRIEIPSDKVGILRIEKSRHVLVHSAMFIDVTFLENLENDGFDYDTMNSLLA